MFAVDVHEFDIVFAGSFLFCGFKDEIQCIGCVFCLDGDDVVVLSGAEDFGE